MQTTSCPPGKIWALLDRYLFAERPEVELRVFGNVAVDLRFLEAMPSLQKFTVNGCEHVENLECLGLLPDLKELSLGVFSLEDFDFLERAPEGLKCLSLERSSSRRPDLSHLKRFGELEELYIEGHTKGIEILSGLMGLKKVTLRSITVKDLSFLRDLPRLWSLALHLGGTTCLEGLRGMTSLMDFEACQVRGLADLDVLSSFTGLQSLRLQSLPRMLRIPCLSDSVHLRKIHLENLKGLKDFRALQGAPGLEEFRFVDAKRQSPSDLLPVLKNPSVKRVEAGFGSDKKNLEFARLRDTLGKRGWN
ncbi:MAG: hypothetical protein ACPG31_10280 [Planctomycetota bacterium]